MANPWFRLYSEFADDPKVQMMPEAMQRRLIMLMCSRCKNETLHETQIAFHWRITPNELADTKRVFIENGFIDEGWKLLNWNRRQFLSDSSTERVRRYRKGMKQDETLHSDSKSEDFISDETERNVTVTAPEQIQIQNRTDSEQKVHSARSEAKVAAKRISQAVNPEADEDLSEWAERIAVAHPRNALKNLGALEIPQKDMAAVVEAILLESAKAETTSTQAAQMLLAVVEELAATVPRSEWHFLKPVTAYFGEFEYRRDPTTFIRTTRAKEGSGNGKRSGRTDGNAEAIQRLLGATDDAGAGSGSIAADPGGCAGPGLEQGEDGGGVHRGDERADAGGVHPGVLQGDAGVQVLPTSRYPPRIQWPGR